ncbi:MAG: biotin carboxyl carrier protein [Roseivirga sp.]|jgi:biotin carboxyl carrier protein
MYKISLEKDQQTEVLFEGDSILVNGLDFQWDLSQINKTKFHILKDNKSFNAEIISFDKVEKIVEIKINNQIYKANVKDKMDQLLQKMGINNLPSTVISDVKAPMPGLIHEISVQLGQEIKKGDPLMVLEAMKMENVLKSPGDGMVKSIEVAVGSSVEKNQILIKF